MSMNDYAMDLAEEILAKTYKRVSEGEITFDDTENVYMDELTSDERTALDFLGIHDEIDFRDEVINESHR